MFLEENTVKVVEDTLQSHFSVGNDTEFGPVSYGHSISIYFK